MAKPRIFISSTYYDLKSLRTDLEHFVREQGYDPILFERGQVAYGSDSPPEEYCHREIENCDILVAIVGGSFGSQSHRGPYSISQVELRTALESNKQVYIFIERDVFNEYRTYNANRDKDILWQSVKDKRVFEFITEMYALPANNAIMPFETSHEIVDLLREQWSGLFQRLLAEASSQLSYSLVSELRQSIDLSRKLAENLASERDEGGAIVQDILLTSHPIFEAVRKRMKIPYRVFFTSKIELDTWLRARTFLPDDFFEKDTNYFEWENPTLAQEKQVATVQIAKHLFDDSGQLKIIRLGQWQDEWVKYTVRVKQPMIDDDVPF